MAEHRASVTVNAPLHQVYQLFTHFNDYPKFMTYVKEVTYLDDERSHWVVDVVGRHEWDALNDGWVPDQEIGWRSTDGLKNSGVVRFAAVGENLTRLEVTVSYDPPAGILGDIGEALGAGKTFEKKLQHDLDHFAQMVQEAPAGALDPESSAYLFHDDSAAGKGQTTRSQDESMEEPTGAGLTGMTGSVDDTLGERSSINDALTGKSGLTTL
ncbi:MAG: SRPBCC family protein [Candidatus Eremiobacteraeota bacterium]|nr:SRPBCC family protein [Candidatus Eremiobacteraeota bacterium]